MTSLARHKAGVIAVVEDVRGRRFPIRIYGKVGPEQLRFLVGREVESMRADDPEFAPADPWRIISSKEVL